MLVTSNKKERTSETSVLFYSGCLPHPKTQSVIRRWNLQAKPIFACQWLSFERDQRKSNCSEKLLLLYL